MNFIHRLSKISIVFWMNIFERVPSASQSFVKQRGNLPTVNRYVDRLPWEDEAQVPPQSAIVTADTACGGGSCTHTVHDSACVNPPLLRSRTCLVKGDPDRDAEHHDDCRYDDPCFLLIPCHGKPPCHMSTVSFRMILSTVKIHPTNHYGLECRL